MGRDGEIKRKKRKEKHCSQKYFYLGQREKKRKKETDRKKKDSKQNQSDGHGMGSDGMNKVTCWGVTSNMSLIKGGRTDAGKGTEAANQHTKNQRPSCACHCNVDASHPQRSELACVAKDRASPFGVGCGRAGREKRTTRTQWVRVRMQVHKVQEDADRPKRRQLARPLCLFRVYLFVLYLFLAGPWSCQDHYVGARSYHSHSRCSPCVHLPLAYSQVSRICAGWLLFNGCVEGRFISCLVGF